MIPAICLLGFLGSILLLNFADKVNTANRYLGYYFILNSLFGLSYWATVISDVESLRAIFAIHYFPFYLLNAPFLYFYVRAVLTEKTKIKGFDYVFFLPFILVSINILPYSILPWEQKMEFVHQFHRDVRRLVQIEFPLLNLSYYILFRAVFSFLVILMSALIVRKSVLTRMFDSSQTLLIWLSICISTAAIINFSMIVLSIQSLVNKNIFLVQFESGQGRTLATLLMSALIISIYFFPKILYGLHFNTGNSLGDVIKLNNQISINTKNSDQIKARIEQIEIGLDAYLPLKKYLKPGFSLSDLVKDVGIPEHLLTFYFNNHQGITFLKWKNQLRIEEAVKLLRAGKADTNTLESVGKACGYKSRSNFIQAFKTQTGESPSAYLKKLR